MAKEVIWTPQAEVTFYKVIEYLQDKWTDREVEYFVNATDKVISYIAEYPLMFRRTNKKNIHEALITPQNLLIYKVYSTHISLITFYDTRQSPRKKKY